MKWCDLLCKYAEWPDKLQDGTCRTFVGLYCKLKRRVVFKNQPCKDKENKNVRKMRKKI